MREQVKLSVTSQKGANCQNTEADREDLKTLTIATTEPGSVASPIFREAEVLGNKNGFVTLHRSTKEFWKP